jgi:threonyl-tRNA synthetase
MEKKEQAELDILRHSAAHVMAEAVKEIFPDAKLGIGPAIENGFYYDFDLPRPLTPDDLAKITEKMRKASRSASPLSVRRFRVRRPDGYFRPAVQAGTDRGTAGGRKDHDLPARRFR